MEPYIHNKEDRLVEESIPPKAPICYLTLRAEALLDRSCKVPGRKDLYKLLRLIRKKALRMEGRLKQYRKAIENLGFIKKGGPADADRS